MVVVLVSPLSNSFRSGPSYGLEVEGLPEANSMLLDAAARGEDMRPAMAKIKLLFIAGHKENFESRGAFFGEPWPANSPETLERKGRDGGSLSSVMVDEGALEEALSGGTGRRTRVSRGSVSVGVSLIEALFSQGGAAGVRRGVQPKRVVLGITMTQREESVAILTDFLMGR